MLDVYRQLLLRDVGGGKAKITWWIVVGIFLGLPEESHMLDYEELGCQYQQVEAVVRFCVFRSPWIPGRQCRERKAFNQP